ncbi:hypothetical protein [Candidatus Cloacimonas acidaminovorans]|jgi:hypothetical protein|uniref:Uncharacterized protein n=1 Tax=Cloacimonas acidaminovorans (strain Evry) TaxID=459349 RepID=B0VHQ3_CLOAI|nr:hypothetical protein [Candidatus Cloacimonas acidaminovorans]CAO80868.1 hypothetical protein CLOAM0996 [Candidatus Cloacimonas acidaminovorans str. Evry]
MNFSEYSAITEKNNELHSYSLHNLFVIPVQTGIQTIIYTKSIANMNIMAVNFFRNCNSQFAIPKSGVNIL